MSKIRRLVWFILGVFTGCFLRRFVRVLSKKSENSKPTYNYSDIKFNKKYSFEFDTEQEAIDARSEIERTFLEYHSIRLADVYQICCGLDNYSYESLHRGWMSADRILIYPSGNKFVLELPNPVFIY